MKIFNAFLVSIFMTAFIAAQTNYEPGVLLLKIREPEFVMISGNQVINGSAQLQTTFREYGVVNSRKLPHVDAQTNGWYRVEFPQDAPLEEILNAFKNCPDIRIATLNHSGILADIPDDPLWTDQWALQKIDIPGAWDIIKPDNTILVGIMDTGLDYAHEDLTENVWQNLGEDADGDGHTLEWNGSAWILDPGDLDGDDDDSNNYADDLVGWNFIYNTNDPQESGHNHGTRAAGVVAAKTYNNTGIAGIAGGWQGQTGVRLVGVPISHPAQGWFELQAYEAIIYLTQLRQQSYTVIANMSIQTIGVNNDEPMPLFFDGISAAKNAGVIMIAAAGNVQSNPHSPYNQPEVEVLPIPARYSGVLAIGASRDGATIVDELRAPYSLYDTEEGKLLVVSPVEENIISGINVYTTEPWAPYYVNSFNGTSAACPIVAGTVVLMLSVNPDLDYLEISDIFRKSAEKIGPYNYTGDPARTQEVGYGRINARRAVFMAGSQVSNIAAESNALNVILSWDSTPYADGYNIYRSLNPNGPFNNRVGTTTETGFIDEVSQKGTYYYQVKAYIETEDYEGQPSSTIAVLVMHMQSFSIEATAHNNGRRVVRDGEGTLHAVYEDGGSIWYTYSIDNGEHWAAETRIAAPLEPETDRCHYPAIAEYEGALHVVYSDVSYEDENPTAAEISYLSKPAGGTWQVADAFPGSGIPHPSQIPKPAVAVWRSGSERYAVISYNRFNVYSRVTTYYKRPGQISQFAGELAGTNPSLGADEPHIDLRLSYENEGRIYVRAWDTGAKTWKAAGQVNDEVWWLTGHFNSNVTFSTDTYAHLVWAPQDETLWPVVAYRAYNKPGAGQVTYFYSGPWRGAVYPTVAADYGTPISIFYEDEGRIIKRRFDGQYWLEEGFSEGRYPNAAAHGQSGAIWVRDDNAPYRIVPDYTDPWKMRANREDTLLVNKRFDYTFVQDSSAGYLTLEIRNLANGGRYLQLDSLLRSSPITIPPTTLPEYQLLIHFHNLNFPVDSSAVLVEAAFEAGPNLHSLGKLRLKQLLPFNNGQAHLLAQTLAAGHLRGKTGRLKFSFENLSPLISNVVVRRPERGVPPLAKPGADSSSTLPTRFELSQNYPNPFNPTTTITLSLPQESRVSLEVYDITGRLVRTLANQPLPAGLHKISWDGRAEGGEPVSSGVYIYRVEAGTFIEARKMVLLR